MRKEVVTAVNKELVIKAEGSKISSVKSKNITKKGARIFKDNKIYSSSHVGSVESSSLLDSATQNSAGAISYDYELPSVISISKASARSKKSSEELIAEYEEVLSFLNKRHADFIFSGSAEQVTVKKELDIVGEATLSNEFDINSLSMLYKHKDSAGTIDGWFGVYSLKDFSFKEVAEKYSKYLSVYSNLVNLKGGSTPVVFLDQQTLFKKILESTRADKYMKNIGLFKEKMGQKVLSDKFTFMDVSYDLDSFATDLFDANGVVRSNPALPLIEKGVLKNLICDARNAKKYNLKDTGNSKRSFDSPSALGFNSVRVQKGVKTSDEMLKALPQCIVVEIAAGGDFTDVGGYSTPVQTGYLLEFGEVKGRIPQITLTSSVEEMFGNKLIDVAKDSISSYGHNPSLFMEMDVIIN